MKVEHHGELPWFMVDGVLMGTLQECAERLSLVQLAEFTSFVLKDFVRDPNWNGLLSERVRDVQEVLDVWSQRLQAMVREDASNG